MTDKDAEIAALKAEVARVTSESKRFSEDVAVQIAELMSSCSRHRETIRVLRHRCDHIENEKIAAEARVAEMEAGAIKERDYLLSLFDDDSLMRGDIEGAFNRVIYSDAGARALLNKDKTNG